MTPVSLATANTLEKPPIRYLDYLRALETLNTHRTNPAPPFKLMLAFALSLHIAIMLLWTIFDTAQEPQPKERVLQLRLGGVPEFGAGAAVNGGGEAPTLDAPSLESVETLLNEALEVEAPPAATIQKAPSQAVKTLARPVAPKAVSRNNKSPEAVAGRRSVSRGTGGFGARGGSHFGNSNANSAEVIARYEQELSGWLERHKVYPESAADAGIEGRVIVRVQMNRSGKVLGSYVEKSSGHPVLDKAVLAQVRRADPFPAAPVTYPGSELLEFRFPVTLYIR
ncbi:MAG: TonB family protein [Rickettsiales bacterium]|nr:TonB family protein [Rickettsiales bacterium]